MAPPKAAQHATRNASFNASGDGTICGQPCPETRLAIAPSRVPSTALDAVAPIERISKLTPPAVATCEAGITARINTGIAENAKASPVPTMTDITMAQVIRPGTTAPVACPSPIAVAPIARVTLALRRADTRAGRVESASIMMLAGARQ